MMVTVVCGCSSGEPDARGRRAAARGTVLIDGEVLEAGKIRFVCDGPRGQVKAVAQIYYGQYRFDETNGPLQGTAKVEILPQEIELEEFEARRDQNPAVVPEFRKVAIPARYNVKSTLTAQVSADVSRNVFDFDLESE